MRDWGWAGKNVDVERRWEVGSGRGKGGAHAGRGASGVQGEGAGDGQQVEMEVGCGIGRLAQQKPQVMRLQGTRQSHSWRGPNKSSWPAVSPPSGERCTRARA